MLPPELDEIAVQLIARFGPFEFDSLQWVRKKAKCDICTTECDRIVIGRPHISSIPPTSTIATCFSVDCLRAVYQGEIGVVHKKIADILMSESVRDITAMPVDTDRKARATIGGSALEELVKEVQERLNEGHKPWTIVPDLIEQFKKRGSLSPKQVGVLQKFLGSL